MNCVGVRMCEEFNDEQAGRAAERFNGKAVATERVCAMVEGVGRSF